MTTPLQQQQQLTSNDQHYFDWSTSKQPTHRRQYYGEQYFLEDKQFQQTQTTNSSPLNHINDHVRKKQKLNGMESSFDELNHFQQRCYPFQAELTQQIDIECGGNGSGQTVHTPTHHFTLNTVINVSVNSQTSSKSLDILSSPSPQPYSIRSNTYSPSVSSSTIPYSEWGLSLDLKDLDLTTLDRFSLPSCPNPQDYLTVDGLLTFLMSNQNLTQQLNRSDDPFRQPYPMYNHRQAYPQYSMSQQYNYPSQNSSSTINSSASSIPIATPLFYRQSSLPQQMTRYYSTSTSTPSYR